MTGFHCLPLVVDFLAENFGLGAIGNEHLGINSLSLWKDDINIFPPGLSRGRQDFDWPLFLGATERGVVVTDGD